MGDIATSLKLREEETQAMDPKRSGKGPEEPRPKPLRRFCTAVVASEELGGRAYGAGIQISEEGGVLPCWGVCL